jgi:hypothetical protein
MFDFWPADKDHYCFAGWDILAGILCFAHLTYHRLT